MKKLKELQSLVNMSRALGQEPEASLLAELQALQQQQDRIAARIKKNIAADLNEIFRSPRVKESQVDAVLDSIALIETMPVLENEETWAQQVIDSQPVPDQIAQSISRQIAAEGTVVRADPQRPAPTAALEQKLKYLENWVSRIAATGPGGGEVNLRWLDDVDRSTIADDYYLRYEATSKKFVFDAGHKNNFYLAAQSTVTQTSSATSATAMTYNVTDFNYGISVGGVNSSDIIIAAPGTYNLQFSSQFINSANFFSNVYIWLRQNGTDIIGSNGNVTVPHKDNANTPGKIVAGWNYYVTTTSVNETIQLMWFVTDNVNTSMVFLSSQAATASSPFIPATASVIITVSPVKVDSY